VKRTVTHSDVARRLTGYRPLWTMAALLALGLTALPRVSGPAAVLAAHPRSDVALTMWTWKVFHKSGWEAVAAAFKAKTGITVNIQAFSPDDLYRTKVRAATNTRQLPDILSYWSGAQWDLAAAGALMDLTGKVSAEGFAPGTYAQSSVLTKDAHAAWVANPTTSKKLLALPVGHVFSVPTLAGSPNFMMFNKSMMKKAGLNPDKAPATFEELIADLKKITAAGQPGFAAAVKNPDVPPYWILCPAYVQAVGRQAYDDQMNGLKPLNNPTFVHMLDLFKELRTSRLWVPGVTNIDIDPADVTFAQQRSSLDVGGTYTFGAIVSLGMDPKNILVFNVPGPAGSVEKFRNGMFSLIEEAITRDSRHPAEALQWLKFSTSAEGAALFAKTANDLPATRLPADPKVVGAPIAQIERFFAGSAGTFTGVTHFVPAGAAYTLLQKDLQQLVVGEGDSTDMMATALQKELDAVNAKTYKGQKPPRVIVPPLK